MDPRARGGDEDERRLDSWKEIAAFFRRDPRTVKRWEKERALPVHRIPGKGRSGVYAYAHELQRWLEQHPVDTVPATEPGQAGSSSGASSSVGMLLTRWRLRGLLVLLILALGTAGLLGVAGAALRPRSVHPGNAVDPEVAQAYLACRYAWSKRSAERLHEAVDCFTRLTERAPRFAPAYAGLADSYSLLREYSLMPDGEAFPRAIAAAQRAVELDPESSLGHRALAFAAFNWSFDVATAEREFRRAIALDPRDAEAHHWFATSLMLLARNAEALEEIARAQELEPTSASIVADRGFILYAAGQQEEALEVVGRLARTEPDLVSPHRYLAEMYFNRNDYRSYLAESRRFAELLGDPEALSAVHAEERALAAGGPSALLEQLRTQREGRHARGSAGAYPVAQIESLLGLREEALSHLEEAVARHEPLVMAMRIDPPLANLHGDPRYQQLLVQLGLAGTPGGRRPRGPPLVHQRSIDRPSAASTAGHRLAPR
jgi:tetratricopeptide (TPR) repeat protein